ncbi:MAG: HPr family phosphocarrier protein [Alphaproteobacteria bacterium]
MNKIADEPGGSRADAQRRTVTISNRLGLHARAAARFVQVASGFNAEVTVTRLGTSVSGSSILGLMMLAAAPGQDIEIETKGAEARAALVALSALVERGFDED